MTKLHTYIRRLHRRQNQIAADFQISQGYLCLLLSGKKTPSLKLALRIESVTQGAVPVSSWAEPTPPPKEKEKEDD